MTPHELSERLNSDVENICRLLLPQGKREGNNWCVGDVTGNPGSSCRIQLTGNKAGLWADFAGNEKGDLLTLYQKSKSVSLKDAIQWAKSYLNIHEPATDFDSSTIRKPSKLQKTLPSGIDPRVIAWFSSRGITEQVLNDYKIVSTGTKVHFPFFLDSNLVFLKYRDIGLPKDKAFSAESGGYQVLFGWQAIPQDAREIVITEGEIDCLTYASQGIPALSIPLGGGKGAKQDNWIQNDYDRLSQFDTIYLSLDMDQAGQEALETILPRLGHHRCKIIKLPKKDANEVAQSGELLDDYITSAQYRDPAEIKAATDFIDDVHKTFEGGIESQGDFLPWPKTNHQFRMRQGEVTVWHGINGHGKSLLVSQIMAHCCIQEIKVCIASMEMRPISQLQRMYQQISGEAVPARSTIDFINSKVMPNLYLINIHGTAKSTRLLELFDYAYLRFGCRHFVVDSLAKCGINEDDYDGQKRFVDNLTDFADKRLSHIHLVAHARKQEDEFSTPNKMDVKGAGSITDMVHNVAGVWRNKKKEDEISRLQMADRVIPNELQDKPACVVWIQKQRNHDWEGKIAFWFDPHSHQYLERSNLLPESMITLPPTYTETD